MTSELKSGVQSECDECHRGQNLEFRQTTFCQQAISVYTITEVVWSHSVVRRIETK